MKLRHVASVLCIMLLVGIGYASHSNAEEVAAKAGKRLNVPVSTAFLVSELFEQELLAENVFAVREHEFELPDSERYDYLANWVLPSETHAAIRMSGAFAPGDPAPIVPKEYLDATGTGGTLVSPAFDLLDLATKLGRLEDLSERVAGIPQPLSESQQRALAAIRLLLALELNDESTVESEMKILQKLVTSVVPKSMADQWPETLVAYRSVTRFPKSAACDIVADLVALRLQQGIPQESAEWHSQIFSLAGRLKTKQISGTGMATESTDVLKNWIPVSRSRWIRDAAGVAQASWRWRGDDCNHVTGGDEDYLFYRSPLTGNFDVDLDLQTYGSTQFLAGGMLFGPRPSPAELETGDIRRGGLVLKPMNPPFNKLDAFVRCRASFRNGTRLVFINGRLVATDTLPENQDPWIGVRSWGRADGRFRNVRISGEPLIPEAVVLSESPDLTGWYSHLDDAVVGEHAYWQYLKTADQPPQIVGRVLDWHDGAISERLLRYIRPMAEDGAVEYDFFYEPGKAVTHPALDRLAMILAPDGVRVHWVTDDNSERTGLLPDNELSALENRRGTDALPLKPNEWNHMKVAVTGNIVTLELNGRSIYERQLESANQRRFGLFNYADQTVSRVRNVVMRGDWPKTVPSLLEQELTNRTLATLDVERSKALVSMSHEFATQGLPDKYFFTPPITADTEIVSTANGVTHEQRSPGNWSQSSITAWFQMHGDFDLSVGFEDWSTTGHDHYGGAVIVNCGSGHRIQVGRRHDKKNDDHDVVVGWLIPVGNGEFQPTFESMQTEATSGNLRLARRGDTWFAMFAENDSSAYQLVGKQKLEGTANQAAVFEMQSIATDSGTSHVLWKDVQIAAEKLMIFPDPLATGKAGLFVMHVDGSGLRQISFNDPDITSPGSADWSPDGKQIAFDQYSNSSIYLVNADGTGLKRIGSGAMPTFSPDGKRLAFSGGGMSVMNIDGTNIQVLSQDGWGAQWSPNGKWLAYESRQRVANLLSSNITLIDVETKQKRTILNGDQASRYSQIFWNMEWSPDSSQICFKGKVKEGGTEMAITNVGGSLTGFTVITETEVVEDFSWHPDGSKIIMGKHSPEHAGHRLFVCDPKTREITLLESQPMDQKSVSGVWSPDGRQIVFSSTPNPKAVPWESPNHVHPTH